MEPQRTVPGSGDGMPELEWSVSELRTCGFTFAKIFMFFRSV